MCTETSLTVTFDLDAFFFFFFHMGFGILPQHAKRPSLFFFHLFFVFSFSRFVFFCVFCCLFAKRRVLVQEWVEGEKGPWKEDGEKLLTIGLQCSVLQVLESGE